MRRLVPILLAAVAVALLWATTREERAGEWLLGSYRLRWFLINVACTYALPLLALIVGLRPSRETVVKVLLAHAAALAAVGTVELTGYLGWVDYRELMHPPARPARPDLQLRYVSAPHIQWKGLGLQDLNEHLGIEAEPIEIDYSTDRHGHRNPTEKPDPDVVCIGDSILVARLVPPADIPTERLEALTGLSIYNGSEAGYSIQEALRRIDLLELDYEGKLVLHFVFEGNDLRDSARWRAWCSEPAGSQWPQSGFLSTLLASLRRHNAQGGGRQAGTFQTPDGPVECYFGYDGREIRRHAAEFPYIADAIRQKRAEILAGGGNYGVVFIPTKIRVLHPFCEWAPESEFRDPEAAQSPLLELARTFCEEEGVPFFSSVEPLQDLAAAGTLPFFDCDTHLNAAGIRALTESLAPWVRELSDNLRSTQ